MRPELSLFALALLLVPRESGAQGARRLPPAFETQLVHTVPAALPSIDDLLASLRDPKDRKKQLEALDQLVLAAGRLAFDEEVLVAGALKEAYDSPVNEGGVRGRALDTLGKCAVWFRDQQAVRDAVEILTEAAHLDNPADPRSSLRVYALMGLSRAAGRMTWVDDRAEQLVVLTGLDGMRDAQSAQEKLLSTMVFANYVESRGAGVIYRNPALTTRVVEQLLAPLSGGVESLYNDPKNTSDLRYFLIRGLSCLAWSPGGQPDWRFRVGKILRDMADRDPDARVRELARLYAGRIGR